MIRTPPFGSGACGSSMLLIYWGLDVIPSFVPSIFQGLKKNSAGSYHFFFGVTFLTAITIQWFQVMIKNNRVSIQFHQNAFRYSEIMSKLIPGIVQFLLFPSFSRNWSSCFSQSLIVHILFILIEHVVFSILVLIRIWHVGDWWKWTFFGVSTRKDHHFCTKLLWNHTCRVVLFSVSTAAGTQVDGAWNVLCDCWQF